MGTMAVFQSSEIIPVSSEHWKIIVEIGAIMELVSLRTLAQIQPGLVALFTLRLLSNLNIPGEE